MALDESLTLENLGLALHDTRTQESRWLLEGFFSLKRQVLVELLSDCCANASAVALGPLESTCYALQDAARWYHPKERCAQLEFELLRLSAQVASRPGHLLLIQSLQRAFRGIADRLLPFMGGDAMRQWVICALDALYARDVQALQHQLPALMRAHDELVLDQLAPVARECASPDGDYAQESNPGAPSSDSAQGDVPTARACAEEHGLACLLPAEEDTEALGGAPRPYGQVPPAERDSGTRRSPVALCEPAGKCTAGDVTGPVLDNLSGCRTDGCTLPPDQAEASPSGFQGQTPVTAYKEGDTQGALGRRASRPWRFIAYSLGLLLRERQQPFASSLPWSRGMPCPDG
ncbi:GntR family transcriptional regulator [Corallococcus aberystwythensis]|uniref:GntR family transcriptional regulator n=1 Tax=Corallococcus aberystwythensis TaxID=2316722 RepID=A0A3A8RA87_9BACT|nr:GntR family transcriptional regulator [Corallococcus aberystwythensis]